MKMPKYLYYYLFLDNENLHKKNLPSLRNLKNAYIGYILHITQNDIHQASDILRMSPPTLYKKRKAKGVHQKTLYS